MLTALPMPEYVAYFTVGIPVDKADRNSARAVEIVTRYLFSGEVTVTHAALDSEAETFLVPVRVEGARSHGDLARQVKANRERLTSGLYASTEPTYLMGIGPRD